MALSRGGTKQSTLTVPNLRTVDLEFDVFRNIGVELNVQVLKRR